ncbi:hypothetical protein [Planobispora longispora]|uniref:Uncharacterized protein n=1 Tax=Planobispora longispora TaxID=28887 RepID=A0A8J3RQU9_9ACTN|nr:hypothetical protein [Planobispora longispora]GIH78207.1 hypothetical protein Plo01_46360 [Planobispora longispora]
MSDGYVTAPQQQALRLICERGRRLARARPAASTPGHAPAITRLAGALAWRLAAQGFITDTGGRWSATADGRRLISCFGGRT